MLVTRVTNLLIRNVDTCRGVIGIARVGSWQRVGGGHRIAGR